METLFLDQSQKRSIIILMTLRVSHDQRSLWNTHTLDHCVCHQMLNCPQDSTVNPPTTVAMVTPAPSPIPTVPVCCHGNLPPASSCCFFIFVLEDYGSFSFLTVKVETSTFIIKRAVEEKTAYVSFLYHTGCVYTWRSTLQYSALTSVVHSVAD